MKTEKSKDYVLQLVDKFGNLRAFNINHYEYSEGNIQLFRAPIGTVVELVEDVEIRKTQMDLVALFLDIGGFWLMEEECGEE